MRSEIEIIYFTSLRMSVLVRKNEMKLVKIIQSQGYGSRKECEGLIKKGRISCDGAIEKNPKADIDPINSKITVNRQRLIYRERVVIALNKPSGYECSHKPQAHKAIFELLTSQLINRKVEPAGRLDADTTGLIILSDDGKLLHQLSSPKKEVIKIYRVTLKHEAGEEFLNALNEGVLLRDETVPSKAEFLEQVSDNEIDLGISSGKYHQVKRMVAAAGNRVEKLHREQIGSLILKDLEIPEGQFLFLTEEQVSGLLK